MRKKKFTKETAKRKSDKKDKTLAIGMYCSGFPMLMIGLSQMVDDINKSSSYSPASIIYYIVGMIMVAYGVKAYYGSNKQMIILISITTIILMIAICLKILVFPSAV